MKFNEKLTEKIKQENRKLLILAFIFLKTLIQFSTYKKMKNIL